MEMAPLIRLISQRALDLFGEQFHLAVLPISVILCVVVRQLSLTSTVWNFSCKSYSVILLTTFLTHDLA